MLKKASIEGRSATCYSVPICDGSLTQDALRFFRKNPIGDKTLTNSVEFPPIIVSGWRQSIDVCQWGVCLSYRCPFCECLDKERSATRMYISPFAAYFLQAILISFMAMG